MVDKKKYTISNTRKVSHWGIALIFILLIILLSFKNNHNYTNPIKKYLTDAGDISVLSKSIHSQLRSDEFYRKFQFIDIAGFYAKRTGRRLFNKVIVLGNGMLTVRENEITENNEKIDELVQYDQFIRSYGGKFLYVQFPYKMDLLLSLSPEGLSEQVNINNQTEEFIQNVSNAGIDVLDTIPLLVQTPNDISENFYRTDLHWKPVGAFKAFKQITEKIKKIFPDEKISDTFLNDEIWTVHEVPNRFLGSWGKRCGKYFGGYDDLQWMTPNFPVTLSYYIKDSNHFVKGQFEDVCIVKELADPGIDLYRKNNYLIQTSGDFSLVQYRNLFAGSSLHILLIKDSYTLPLQTFLVTEFSQIDVIDPRYFNETSLMEYTDRIRPDLVIMEVSPEAFFYDSYYKFGEADEGSVSDRTEVIPKTDFHIPFADSDNNHITYDGLENDRVYSISIQEIIVEEGTAEGISICLHNNETDENLTSTAFDIQYCNETQECFWTFQTPESGCEDLSLRVYSGMPGETQNNLITLIGFQMIEGKRYSDSAKRKL